MRPHHVALLKWAEAIDQVEAVNPKLAAAMKPLAKATEASVYWAQYGYGDQVVDGTGKLRTPCSQCDLCQRLKQACGNNLPLGLVIEQCLEVHHCTESKGRAIPLRLLGPGESFGLFELLDQLYPHLERETQPPWQVVAGAKSVFITSPYCTEPLGKALRGLLPQEIVNSQFSRRAGKSVAKQLSVNPYLFIRYLEKAALHTSTIKGNDALQPWTASALIFPPSVLVPALSRKSGFVAAAKECLLQIHEAAWIQSRNLRRRETEAAEIERSVENQSNSMKRDLARAIQHILAVVRGDLPAFVPYSPERAAGPFKTVHDFFLEAKLAERLAQRTFPAILQPCHIGDGQRQSSFGYCSLSVPSIIGCDRTFNKEFAETLCEHLSDGSFGGQFGAKLYESLNEPALQADFAYQFNMASEKWHVKEDEFFRDFKQGFTVRFMRIQCATAARSKAAV